VGTEHVDDSARTADGWVRDERGVSWRGHDGILSTGRAEVISRMTDGLRGVTAHTDADAGQVEGVEVTANPHGLVLDRAVRLFLESIDGPSTAGEPDVPLQKGLSAVGVDERSVTVDAGECGSVRVRVVRPAGTAAPLPAVVYVAGEGWVPGTARSHTRLFADLARGSGAVLVVPECTPGADLSVSLGQAYATACWVLADGDEWGIDPSRIAIAGDSTGAHLAIGLVLETLHRNDFRFSQLVAFTPVTDVACDTESCRRFAEGYYLRRNHLVAFRDRLSSDGRQVTDPSIAPLHADAADLAGFPPSLVITAEADVVRDQGEAFAARLRAAGTPTTAVRYEGTIHGFVTLDALRDTSASRAAVAQAAAALRPSLRT
jgi:acetyl esterase/lipase